MVEWQADLVGQISQWHVKREAEGTKTKTRMIVISDRRDCCWEVILHCF